MKAFTSVGAVLLPFIAATASGIEFNPDDEGGLPLPMRKGPH